MASTRKSPVKGAMPTPARPGVLPTCLLAWLFPGAGHLLQGEAGKALVFGASLLPMYVIGLVLGGQLFAFQGVEPLMLLAAGAEWMMGASRVVAASAGYGAGDVVAASYEYGNSFLIVAGLLNVLVMFDAADVARGQRTEGA